MPMLNKQRIAQRFNRAAATYHRHAVVQSNVCRQLMWWVKTHCPQSFERVLEVGCGSGNLTRLLQQYIKINRLYLNDLNMGNLSQKPVGITHIEGDMERIRLPENLDAIFSASALQWANQPAALFARFAQALNHQGWLCFAAFGTDNLSEIRQILGVGLDYVGFQAACTQLPALGFEVCMWHEERQILFFEHANAVLRHLQASGVTAAGDYCWSRGGLQRFDAAYRQLAAQHGNDTRYPLTYHPIYCIARKIS